MLFGSVPRPPRKPKSSISTQSAKHSTRNAARAGRTTSRRPVRNEAPITASAITATRLTAKPWSRTTELKPDTRLDRKCGCDVPAIVWVMPVRVPGWLPTWPCQKPRPGQACSTAMPIRNSPNPASSSPAQFRRLPAPVRQHEQRARDGVDQHRPGGAEQPGQPRSEDPAEGLAEDPHDQPPDHADQPGQPAREAARSGQQPQADPDLNPYRRGAGLDRVVGPRGPGPVHQVLHPVR